MNQKKKIEPVGRHLDGYTEAACKSMMLAEARRFTLPYSPNYKARRAKLLRRIPERARALLEQTTTPKHYRRLLRTVAYMSLWLKGEVIQLHQRTLMRAMDIDLIDLPDVPNPVSVMLKLARQDHFISMVQVPECVKGGAARYLISDDIRQPAAEYLRDHNAKRRSRARRRA